MWKRPGTNGAVNSHIATAADFMRRHRFALVVAVALALQALTLLAAMTAADNAEMAMWAAEEAKDAAEEASNEASRAASSCDDTLSAARSTRDLCTR
uniref:Unannotated protein n=1 Tax=freshwater metagenome TaxID=449393 RepID=A0A6J5YXX5_9ZZZZ